MVERLERLENFFAWIVGDDELRGTEELPRDELANVNMDRVNLACEHILLREKLRLWSLAFGLWRSVFDQRRAQSSDPSPAEPHA